MLCPVDLPGSLLEANGRLETQGRCNSPGLVPLGSPSSRDEGKEQMLEAGERQREKGRTVWRRLKVEGQLPIRLQEGPGTRCLPLTPSHPLYLQQGPHWLVPAQSCWARRLPCVHFTCQSPEAQSRLKGSGCLRRSRWGARFPPVSTPCCSDHRTACPRDISP